MTTTTTRFGQHEATRLILVTCLAPARPLLLDGRAPRNRWPEASRRPPLAKDRRELIRLPFRLVCFHWPARRVPAANQTKWPLPQTTPASMLLLLLIYIRRQGHLIAINLAPGRVRRPTIWRLMLGQDGGGRHHRAASGQSELHVAGRPAATAAAAKAPRGAHLGGHLGHQTPMMGLSRLRELA